MTGGGRFYEPLLNWLVFAPLWSVALALLVGMVVCAWFGQHLQKTMSDASGSPLGAEQEGYVISAISGLLALLIGFTFSVAMDRFDERREQVLDQCAHASTSLVTKAHRARGHFEPNADPSR